MFCADSPEVKRRYCQKFSPGPARRRPCKPWITVEATRRASRMSRGIALASERAAPVACPTAAFSISLSFGSAMRLSDARLKPPDDVGNGLAFRAGRKGKRHAVFENWFGEFEHVVHRRREAAVEQRAGAHGEHQGLARARPRPPGDQLADLPGVRTGARRANEREDRLHHGLA